MTSEALDLRAERQLRAAYRLVLSWPTQDSRLTSDDVSVAMASGDPGAHKEEQTQQINTSLTTTLSE